MPCINPDFDHSPRSSYKWIVMKGSTPEKWGQLCKECVDILNSRKEKEQLLFIKSWNEWGEGNYLEPDQKFGSAYLVATRSVFIKN
jgi:hypothetical protein